MSPTLFGFRLLTVVLTTAPAMSAEAPAPRPGKSPNRPLPRSPCPPPRRPGEHQRGEIRATLWRLLGDLPPRPAVPRVERLAREEHPGYLLERFRFDNGAGASVPGVLLLPRAASGPVPAILYCHWHGGEYDKGKIELFERAHTPEEPGPAFARRGYAVLAIDAYGFGERNGKGPGSAERGGAGELTASKYNLWLGRTLWGMILRDDLMALDYLAARPEVDPTRLGVTGISMGATRSWWLMALDDRIRAGVAVACLTRYQNLIAHEGLQYHGIYYYVPGLLRHFDTEAVIALAAPRPLLCLNGDQDAGSPADGIEIINARARPAWALLGAPEHYQSELYPGVGHVYLPAMWAKTLAWFERHLQPTAAVRP
ncbi:MAG: prolyl oligopeptidase family serine peptidase [Verrucomicrobia bacterium]|nr:prolyl oligopeptidase family serine peptidase [Verrucomicrobiota bacterium]